MQLPHSLLLTLTSLTAAVALPTASSPPQSFTGKGQLRALWNAGDHADLGCLTASGQWTANNALCGTFTATQVDGGSLRAFQLASSAGPCRIYGARFTCEAGEGYSFGVS